MASHGNTTSVGSLVRSNKDGYMSFVDFDASYNDINKQFLRTDQWEFRFDHWPTVVYNPGQEIINQRLQSINVGLDYSVNGFEKRMRGGFSVYQQTGQQTSGQLSLSFIDREDNSIHYACQTWRDMIADPDTKYSFRKADLVAQGTLFILNVSRIPVESIEFDNLIITDAQMDENGAAEDGADRSDIVLNMKFEHHHRSFLNVE